MSTYRLRLRPLTPIHVGSGEQLEAYQYAVQGDTVYALSLPRLVEGLSPIERERYFSALEGGPLAARDELQTLLRSHDPALLSRWQASASAGFNRYVTGRLDSRNANLEVRLLPRAPAGAYLPGSSLKGSIRTALLSDQLEQTLNPNEGTQLDFEYRQNTWQPRPGKGCVRVPGMRQRGGDWTRANQLLEATVLNYETTDRKGKPRANISADPLRALAVTDTHPLPETSFMQLEVWGSKDKPGSPGSGPEKPTGITLLAEVWQQGEVEATLRIDEAYQDHSATPLTFKPRLADIAYASYSRYIELAEAEADTYYERRWDKAYDHMQAVLDEIEGCLDAEGNFKQPYRFPLRLGFGSGDLSLRLAEFIVPDLEPVSRKLAEELPLGWLMVEVLT